MPKRWFLGMLALVSVPAWTQPPASAVRTGNAIERAGAPGFRVTVPRAAAYAGSERFELYGVADAEIHLFVEADANRQVRKLYWIQFEEYLPSNDHRYNYSEGNQHRLLWGLDFWTVANPHPTDAPTRAGSDRESVYRLLKAGGYILPSHMMLTRLVHIPDGPTTGQGRRELMLIYAEDLALSGQAFTEITTEGKANDRWPPVGEALLERAHAVIKVERR